MVISRRLSVFGRRRFAPRQVSCHSYPILNLHQILLPQVASFLDKNLYTPKLLLLFRGFGPEGLVSFMIERSSTFSFLVPGRGLGPGWSSRSILKFSKNFKLGIIWTTLTKGVHCRHQMSCAMHFVLFFVGKLKF